MQRAVRAEARGSAGSGEGGACLTVLGGLTPHESEVVALEGAEVGGRSAGGVVMQLVQEVSLDVTQGRSQLLAVVSH